MSLFFTADQHFGHANILQYEAHRRVTPYGQTFASVEAMNEALIEHWNTIVQPDDSVYCLGDFSYKKHTIAQMLPRLHGHIILVVGNHDPWFKPSINGEMEQARKEAIELGFADAQREIRLELLSIGEILMAHFPYLPPNPEDEAFLRYENLRPQPGKEAVLLHGHVHSQWQTRRYSNMPPMINVGVDVQGLRPVGAEVILGLMNKWDKEK